MKAILFDIDGTLTTTVSGATFKQHPRDVLPMQGVIEGLNYYYNQNPKWELIGISNQGGVAAGHKSIQDAIAEMIYTLELLPQLSAIYFCPDFEGKDCYRGTKEGFIKVSEAGLNHEPKHRFRKPGAGMIMMAGIEYGIDFDKSWMIGDRAEDEAAAQAANINFMWADIWRMRFTPGMYEINPVTPQQVEFLEGISVSKNLVDVPEINSLLQPPNLN